MQIHAPKSSIHTLCAVRSVHSLGGRCKRCTAACNIAWGLVDEWYVLHVITWSQTQHPHTVCCKICAFGRWLVCCMQIHVPKSNIRRLCIARSVHSLGGRCKPCTAACNVAWGIADDGCVLHANTCSQIQYPHTVCYKTRAFARWPV